jgi:hypothetical protein
MRFINSVWASVFDPHYRIKIVNYDKEFFYVYKVDNKNNYSYDAKNKRLGGIIIPRKDFKKSWGNNVKDETLERIKNPPPPPVPPTKWTSLKPTFRDSVGGKTLHCVKLAVKHDVKILVTNFITNAIKREIVLNV